MTCDQLEYAEQWLVFTENIATHLSMDETSLSHGELYSIVTNKAAKGWIRSLVAIIKGTVSNTIIAALRQIPDKIRNTVTEINIDPAPTMELITKRSFSKAVIVSDRFHVQKLASDAVQELRIKYRWQAIEQENSERALAKQTGHTFKPNILENGDTLKQLLARSRYLLFKSPEKWSPRQRHRAEILFAMYPRIKQAYNLSQRLSKIFGKKMTRQIAYKNLALWYNEVEKA